jgi:hypothetical protein
MRRLARIAWGAVGFTMLAVSCTPTFVRHDSQPARPSVDSRELEDIQLLNSANYRSLRGAAAQETPGSELRRKRAIANAFATDYVRRREGPLYRRRDAAAASDGLPQQCLALSGGGMRALAFDAGVLYGLERRGLFPKTDVVSGVSGGGYASYWLLGHLQSGGSETQVLSGPQSDALLQLREHASDLVAGSTGGLFVGGVVAWQAPQALLPAARMPLLPTGANVRMAGAAGHMAYESALDHMLLGEPVLLPSAGALSTDALRELVSSGRAPVPIWVATARPVPSPQCVSADPTLEIAERSRSILYSAFELGPTRMGSEELGFLTHSLLPPINVITVSSAAMSLPINEHCTLLHTIDASIRVTNFPAPRDPTAPPVTSQRSLPTDQPFDLLDGGMADNLGMFPLIRRLCSDITVVDAGFDPFLAFDAYGYLKQQLAQLDIELEIPALEEVAARNRAPGGADLPCRAGVCLIRPRAECMHKEQAAGCVASDELPVAVFEGEVHAIPLASRAAAGSQEAQHWTFSERTLRVHYVKLSLDAAHIDRYPASVRIQYRSDLKQRRTASASAVCKALEDNGVCSFPHKPTTDLDFRGAKFEAYWDLGRCILEQDWDAATEGHPLAPCADSNWSRATP